MNIYQAVVKSNNEIDSLEKVLYLYSTYKYLKDDSCVRLRTKLVTLFGLYIKYVYNSDSKDIASEILNVKKASIDSMNLELRKSGYLIMDKMNQRINHLNDELQTLGEYYRSLDGNSIPFLFNIKISE
jgi:hypothetical protein